jgi:hypothetical protein
MRSTLVCALSCVLAAAAAAQERQVTFEESPPVAITGFAVGRGLVDRETNTLAAGKLAVSLFKPVGDFYFFGQLTTALEDGATETEIDNLLVSWTPARANRWTLAFGRLDAPLGVERDDEPLNFLPTTSFTFELTRPVKLTGAVARFAASPAFELTAALANGWNVDSDNNRDKTGLVRAQWIARPGVTLGLAGVYGAERDGTNGHPRALVSADATVQAGRLIVGAEFNFGGEQQPGAAALNWTGVAATGFVRLGASWGVAARLDRTDDTDGALGAGTLLNSVTIGPLWFFRSAQEGIFSNIEHTTFHLPQIALRTALRFDHARDPSFEDAAGNLHADNVRAVVELVYLF